MSLRDAASLIAVKSRGCRAEVRMLVKRRGLWRETLYTAEAWVGRGGVSPEKTEGDGRTPAGLFTLSLPFGAEPPPEGVSPYLRLTGDEYWVDDPESIYYNSIVRLGAAEKDWRSAEHLIENREAYACACCIDYNPDRVHGAGSAIFLHCSVAAPSSGCVAVPKPVMRALLQALREDTLISIS